MRFNVLHCSHVVASLGMPIDTRVICYIAYLLHYQNMKPVVRFSRVYLGFSTFYAGQFSPCL